MRIVIQCASTKNSVAEGSGLRTLRGNSVRFVARPELAPRGEQRLYVRPDDAYDKGTVSWRDHVLAYNKSGVNPLGLLPAYRLYTNEVYGKLVARFGLDRVFILSAGWGLIPAEFLIPEYDITFSQANNVPAFCHRAKGDRYNDFCLLPDDGQDTLFLGGKDYLPLFTRLTGHLRGNKKIFYNSSCVPSLGPDFAAERFATTQRTNWHYKCAAALIAGDL